jgi:hypothetical protein
MYGENRGVTAETVGGRHPATELGPVEPHRDGERGSGEVSGLPDKSKLASSTPIQRSYKANG